jgi:hypothetical protein
VHGVPRATASHAPSTLIHVTVSSPLFVPAPRGGTALKVFLSHASADKAEVELVREQLELSAAGVDVYLAEGNPGPGTMLTKKVQDAIKRADLVVVLFTEQGMNSGYVHQEIGYALAHNKIVVPIVDKSVDTSRLGMLTGVEWISVDLTDPAGTMAVLSAQLAPLIRKQAAAKRQSELVEGLAGALLLMFAAYLFARSTAGNA